MNFFLQLCLHGLFVGSTYALIALGYSMVYGVLGLINFAHGDVLMVGTLLCFSSIRWIQHHFTHLPHAVTLSVSLLISMILSGLLGQLLELFAYRKIRQSSTLICLTTAIGASILLQSGAMMIWGRNYYKFPQYIPMTAVQIGNISLPFSHLFTIVLALAVMAILWLIVQYSRLGMAIRSVSESSKISELMGINSNKIVSLTFFIGSALASLAGVIMASNYGSAHCSMGFVPGIKAFTAAVLGGIGNIVGSMLGGLLLGLVESIGTGYISSWTHGTLNSNYRDIFSFIILILIFFIRPNGLLGQKNPDRA